MTLRARLVSVLLFLGLSMVIPLAFSLADLWSLEEELVRLEKDVHELGVAASRSRPAELALLERSLEVLTEVVARARRVATGQGNPEELRASLERFRAHWAALEGPSAPALAALPESATLLGLPAEDGPGWEAAAKRVATLEASEWPEDPAGLEPYLPALEGANDPEAAQEAYMQLKQVALVLRQRLLDEGKAAEAAAPSSGGEEAIRRAQVRGTGKVVLGVVVDSKRREVTRIGFLVCIGGLLAVLFARVLWRDLLGPLDRLRVSINNMAMSGTPTPVDTDGPREVRDLLQAYNRLIDALATENQSSDKVPCSKCSVQVEAGDKYCRSCGFPL